LCIKTSLFWGEFKNKNKSPKTPGNTFSSALLMSRFQKITVGVTISFLILSWINPLIELIAELK